MGIALYCLTRASCSSSIQFILKNTGNYVRFTNMQKPFYTAHMFPFVFTLKTDKFPFVANDMRTIPSTHMRIWFANIQHARVYEALCTTIDVRLLWAQVRIFIR